MTWSRLTDFNTYAPGSCAHAGEYSHPDSPVKMIYAMMQYTGEYQISAKFDDSELALQFRQSLVEKELDDISGESQVTLGNLNPEKLSIYFKLLMDIEPTLREIRKEIFQNFKFDLALGFILENLKEESFDEATDLVLELQQNQCYELGYQFFVYYYEQSRLPIDQREVKDISLKKLYEFGNKISKANPYFNKTQQLCLDLLMQEGEIVLAKEEKMSSLDEEKTADDTEYFDLLKLKFKHARYVDQDLAKLLYKELCGIPMNENGPKLIQGDYETLIEKADFLRSANMKIRALEQQLQNPKLSASPTFFSSVSIANKTEAPASEFKKMDFVKNEKRSLPNTPHFRRPGT